MTLKKPRKTVLVLVLLEIPLVFCFSRAVLAQAPECISITVDENGNGLIGVCAEQSLPLPGVLGTDPGPGGLANVLSYDLLGPPALNAGDVILTEPGVSGGVSDVIRFNPAGTGGIVDYLANLLFYSDNADGADSLADGASSPGTFYANTVTIPELGTEANNGALYTPGPNDPGYVPGFAVTYNFISDEAGVPAIPEPAVSILLLTALFALAAVRVTKSRRARA